VGLSADAIALAFRAELPFVGLRGHEHDPELDRIIPPAAARAARALPLAADDDRVRLAVADPSVDLSALSPYLEGRRVELAIAPREELEEILGPPPLAPPPPATAAAPTGIEEEAVAEQPLAAPPPATAVAPTGIEEEGVAQEPLLTVHPAPAGEEPSWLETPRARRRRVVVALLVLLLVVLVAGAVVAYLLTR
jgi:Type II secretion system (T2SS), protein E, N-terminal domain